MILADIARIGIVLCMLLARSKSTVWIIYPLLLLETVMASFFEPARSSVIPNIVKEEEAILANTLSSVTWSFDLAVGAMFGGLVAAAFGRDSVFLLNAASFGVSAILIARMRFHEPHVTGTKPFHARELVSVAPVVEGLNYVRRERRLLYSVCLKAGVGLIGSSWVLLPVMGERVFPLAAPGRDAHQASILSMSVLMAARGLGALVGPLLSARWAGSKTQRLRMGSWLGYACYGVGYGLVFLAPNIWMAALGVVIAHSGGAVVWTFSTTLLQLMTDDNYRGRVFAAELSLCTLTISIATYCVGVALDWGVHPLRVALFTAIASLLPLSLWSVAMMRWHKK
jgi:predicted MFS family arabinose efflux permease